MSESNWRAPAENPSRSCPSTNPGDPRQPATGPLAKGRRRERRPSWSRRAIRIPTWPICTHARRSPHGASKATDGWTSRRPADGPAGRPATVGRSRRRQRHERRWSDTTAPAASVLQHHHPRAHGPPVIAHDMQGRVSTICQPETDPTEPRASAERPAGRGRPTGNEFGLITGPRSDNRASDQYTKTQYP